MFCVGDYIVYGVSGICRVVDISPSPYNKNDARTFYHLVPVNSPTASNIYTPVDNAFVPMRPLMTREDIEKLIEQMPDIETLPVPAEKQRRDIYRAALGSLDPVGYVRVIKTVKERREQLCAARKHFPITDLEYGRLARHLLCSECALVMGVSEADADAYLLSSLGEAE